MFGENKLGRDDRAVNRRTFLRGSALLAASVGLAHALPARAQEPQAKPAEDEKKKDDTTPAKKALLDKDGREYRVCDMCGGNMYKQGKTWTCEQCGFSYDE